VFSKVYRFCPTCIGKKIFSFYRQRLMVWLVVNFGAISYQFTLNIDASRTAENRTATAIDYTMCNSQYFLAHLKNV